LGVGCFLLWEEKTLFLKFKEEENIMEILISIPKEFSMVLLILSLIA